MPLEEPAQQNPVLLGGVCERAAPVQQAQNSSPAGSATMR